MDSVLLVIRINELKIKVRAAKICVIQGQN